MQKQTRTRSKRGQLGRYQRDSKTTTATSSGAITLAISLPTLEGRGGEGGGEGRGGGERTSTKAFSRFSAERVLLPIHRHSNLEAITERLIYLFIFSHCLKESKLRRIRALDICCYVVVVVVVEGGGVEAREGRGTSVRALGYRLVYYERVLVRADDARRRSSGEPRDRAHLLGLPLSARTVRPSLAIGSFLVD